jgi:diguanylate cyclase (GGDEF)-like protein
MVVAFIATVAFVIEHSSRVADRFALDAELRLTGVEFERVAADARRDLSEVAYWDDTVEALVAGDDYDLEFVDTEIVDWMIPDLGFAWIASIEPDDSIGIAVVDDQVFVEPESMPMVSGHADLIVAARERYRNSRVKTGNGFVVPASGEFETSFPVSAFRAWDGVPGVITAQVIVPDSTETALPDDDGVVFVAFMPLSREEIGSIGRRLGLPGAGIVPADTPRDLPSWIELPDEFGPSQLVFSWRPHAPRPAIMASALPLATGLCLVICAALFFIVRKHARAMHALAESEERNRRMAKQDALTGLPNRAHFDDYLHSLTARDEQPPVAVMCIDLDKFKAVNDTHGHHAGDAVLREVASRLQACIGDIGMVARVGGDEFIAVVTDNIEPDYLYWLGDQIIESVSQPVHFQSHSLEVGASIGVAFWPGAGNTAHDVIVVADRLLYDSKTAGRGRTTVMETSLKPIQRQARKMAS